MTGCYQWIQLFNGDAKDWKEFFGNKYDGTKESIKKQLEEYDILMINLDNTDQRLVYEVREYLGNSSSTIIVVNQDHAPEIWNQCLNFLPDYRQAILHSDKVFATSPIAQKLMQVQMKDERQVHLCPHPCETHILKHMKSVYDSDHLLCFWHRYTGGESLIPYITTRDVYPRVSLCGYMESADLWKQQTTTMFKSIIPSLNYPDFIKLLIEAKAAFEPFKSYSYGRNTCDSAAVGLPVVGSNTLYSMQINYPLTNFDTYDVQNNQAKLNEILKEGQFRNEVISLAQFNVEYFGHKESRNRFMSMIEDMKTEIPTTKEIETKSKRGEADTISH